MFYRDSAALNKFFEGFLNSRMSTPIWYSSTDLTPIDEKDYEFSGGTAPSGATVPHPIMIGNDGLPYAQMNAVQIGGFGGLNN